MSDTINFSAKLQEQENNVAISQSRGQHPSSFLNQMLALYREETQRQCSAPSPPQGTGQKWASSHSNYAFLNYYSAPDIMLQY